MAYVFLQKSCILHISTYLSPIKPQSNIFSSFPFPNWAKEAICLKRFLSNYSLVSLFPREINAWLLCCCSSCCYFWWPTFWKKKCCAFFVFKESLRCFWCSPSFSTSSLVTSLHFRANAVPWYVIRPLAKLLQLKLLHLLLLICLLVFSSRTHCRLSVIYFDCQLVVCQSVSQSDRSDVHHIMPFLCHFLFLASISRSSLNLLLFLLMLGM